MTHPISDEYTELRTQLRRFLQERIAPRLREAERTGIYPEGLIEEVGAAGFFGTWFPERVGGSAMDYRAPAIVADEMGNLTPQLSVALNQQGMSCPYTILEFGRKDIAEPFVRDLLAGRKIGMWSLTESGGGSDPANTVKTRAVRDGDHYVINGSKMFATGANRCDVGVLFARTSSEPGHRSLSAFIVEPRKCPGWRAEPIRFQGLSRVFNTCEVSIEDLRVHKDMLLGEEGDGFKIAMQGLVYGRLSVGARALGVAKGVLEEGAAYVNNRMLKGEPLSKFQAIQMEFGEVDASVFAAEAALYSAIDLLNARQPANRAMAIAKYVCGRAAKQAAELIGPMFGGYSLAEEYRICDLRAHANLFEIGEGSPHVQKLLIGQHRLGLKDADRGETRHLE
ncbi:acyl-CoA dehydrogenase family protein [Ramlibacter sp.]|uniref:acyl-CoA dehydrogenase family protein n=1 Tax=Ramlibacter sp. TaxID=1917967 RepID=UPI003D140191